MQSVPCGRYSLLGMQSRGAANRHDFHRTMRQELFEVGIRHSAIFTAQSADFFRVHPEYRSDFDARNRARRARVRLADISSTDQSDISRHSSLYLVADAIP